MIDIQEDRIQATMLFVKTLKEREAAEFICHQQNAIEGLTANNTDFVNAFREFLGQIDALKAEIARLRALLDAAGVGDE